MTDWQMQKCLSLSETRVSSAPSHSPHHNRVPLPVTAAALLPAWAGLAAGAWGADTPTADFGELGARRRPLQQSLHTPSQQSKRDLASQSPLFLPLAQHTPPPPTPSFFSWSCRERENLQVGPQNCSITLQIPADISIYSAHMQNIQASTLGTLSPSLAALAMIDSLCPWKNIRICIADASRHYSRRLNIFSRHAKYPSLGTLAKIHNPRVHPNPKLSFAMSYWFTMSVVAPNFLSRPKESWGRPCVVSTPVVAPRF